MSCRKQQSNLSGLRWLDGNLTTPSLQRCLHGISMSSGLTSHTQSRKRTVPLPVAMSSLSLGLASLKVNLKAAVRECELSLGYVASKRKCYVFFITTVSVLLLKHWRAARVVIQHPMNTFFLHFITCCSCQEHKTPSLPLHRGIFHVKEQPHIVCLDQQVFFLKRLNFVFY